MRHKSPVRFESWVAIVLAPLNWCTGRKREYTICIYFFYLSILQRFRSTSLLVLMPEIWRLLYKTEVTNMWNMIRSIVTESWILWTQMFVEYCYITQSKYFWSTVSFYSLQLLTWVEIILSVTMAFKSVTNSKFSLNSTYWKKRKTIILVNNLE